MSGLFRRMGDRHPRPAQRQHEEDAHSSARAQSRVFDARVGIRRHAAAPADSRTHPSIASATFLRPPACSKRTPISPMHFSRIEARAVDLESGDFTDDVDASSFDQRRAARDPALSTALPRNQDVAGIGRRARYATVYLVKDGEAIEQIILPIHGYGLWSTLYGFIALEPDLNTVVGLKFYEHGETAGLGAEVDNPAWYSKWRGRRVFDSSGTPVLRVAKAASMATGDAAAYEVDGLAGATLTSNGVTNMLHFWLGEQGFGPFLDSMRKQIGSS